MPTDFSLSPLIAATAQWLTRAYPSGRGALERSLAEVQSRQAVTLAAWLRYPTELDVQLVALTGPGGSDRLDWITGADAHTTGTGDPQEHAWRSWVDEVVASWAACLLSVPSLAAAAAQAVSGTDHVGTLPVAFRRLTEPASGDRQAAALLRHPDLLAPIAELHREPLLTRLGA
ncbi:hypothetical protein ABZ128_32460 [Streptomyces sp. NPDC006326]|uniref:hypothetical protein n=1 Tax=Streptomyces sp. NPDC006326 TaxID=3156752 RepID=UPI0033A1D150